MALPTDRHAAPWRLANPSSFNIDTDPLEATRGIVTSAKDGVVW